MAYTTTRSAPMLSQRISQANAWMIGVANRVGNDRALAATSGLPLDRLLDLQVYLRDSVAQFVDNSGVPRFAERYREEFDKPAGYDPVVEMLAVRDGCVALADWMQTATPTDGTGYIREKQFDANGYPVGRLIDVTQLAGFLTRADALLALID